MQGLTLQLIDTPHHPQLPALRELLLEYQRWLGIEETAAYVFNPVAGVKYMALELSI